MFQKAKNKRVALFLFLCGAVVSVTLFGCVGLFKKPPVAKVSATPTTVKMGESIIFSAADSTDSNGGITSYKWDFGDGNTASGKTATHTYSDKGGTYNVKLTVTDNDGLSDTAKISVYVVVAALKIEATSSTWREGEEPYDIYSAIKKRLEKVGLKVVPEESGSYDATLLVDYKETKSGEYAGGSHGTSIRCDLKLRDKTDNLLFEKDILASTSFFVKGSTLYENAVGNFESEVYFKYLGEIIATKFGVGDGVSVLISALKDEDEDVRRKTADILGEIGDERAVEPLIQSLKDEVSAVRQRAAEALGKIGDERAVEPLTQALEDESSLVQGAAREALGKIQGK